MTPLQPCPYHDPAKPDCGHTRNCPFCITGMFFVCTSLNPKQIVMVRSWIEGRAPEPEGEVGK
ncbi:MAG: hypothetical protein M0Q91_05355 [Methanoregula sp.]|nr:hypothetical protein [Methanoregula sp.]